MSGIEFFEDGPKPPAQKTKRPNSNTPILDAFSRDLIKLAEDGKIDPIVGRDKEIKRISQILSRKKKNNALIVGDAGIGKCICGDTIVTIRNDHTGVITETTINNLIKEYIS